MKNREKLAQMTNEELAKTISVHFNKVTCAYCPIIQDCVADLDNYDNSCERSWKNWLEREVEREVE